MSLTNEHLIDEHEWKRTFFFTSVNIFRYQVNKDIFQKDKWCLKSFAFFPYLAVKVGGSVVGSKLLF